MAHPEKKCTKGIYIGEMGTAENASHTLGSASCEQIYIREIKH